MYLHKEAPLQPPFVYALHYAHDIHQNSGRAYHTAPCKSLVSVVSNNIFQGFHVDGVVTKQLQTKHESLLVNFDCEILDDFMTDIANGCFLDIYQLT